MKLERNINQITSDKCLEEASNLIKQRELLQEQETILAEKVFKDLVESICKKMSWKSEDLKRVKVSVQTQWVKTPRIMCEIFLNPEIYPSERHVRYVFQYDEKGLQLNFRQELEF